MRLPAMTGPAPGVWPRPPRPVAACAAAGFPAAANAPATRRATRSRNREDRSKATRVDPPRRAAALLENRPQTDINVFGPLDDCLVAFGRPSIRHPFRAPLTCRGCTAAGGRNQ